MRQNLLKKIEEKSIRVGVVGLGYVGLPLAVEKAKAGFETKPKSGNGERGAQLYRRCGG